MLPRKAGDAVTDAGEKTVGAWQYSFLTLSANPVVARRARPSDYTRKRLEFPYSRV
jgi:hypothetical protein